MKCAPVVIRSVSGRAVRGAIAASYHPGSEGSKNVTSRARVPPTVVHPIARASIGCGPHHAPGTWSGVWAEATHGPRPLRSQRLPPMTTALAPLDDTYARRLGAARRHVVVTWLRGLDARRSRMTTLRSAR